MTDSFSVDELVSFCKDKTTGIGEDIAGMISSVDREDAARILQHCCYSMHEADRVFITDACMSVFLPLTDGSKPLIDEFFNNLVDAVLYFSDEGTRDVLVTAFEWFSVEVQRSLAESLRDLLYIEMDVKKQPHEEYAPLANRCFEALRNEYDPEWVAIAYDLLAITAPGEGFTISVRALKKAAAERDEATFQVVYDPFLISMALAGPEYKDRAKHILKQKDVALMYEACFPESDYVEGI